MYAKSKWIALVRRVWTKGGGGGDTDLSQLWSLAAWLQHNQTCTLDGSGVGDKNTIY